MAHRYAHTVGIAVFGNKANNKGAQAIFKEGLSEHLEPYLKIEKRLPSFDILSGGSQRDAYAGIAILGFTSNLSWR